MSEELNNQTVSQCSWTRRNYLRGGNWQECCQFNQGHKDKCSFDILVYVTERRNSNE